MPFHPNPIYEALTTHQAAHALTHGLAVRYQPDIIPFAAVAEPTPAAFAHLHDLLAPNESIFVTADPGQTFPTVPGLTHISALPGVQMSFDAAPPAPEPANDPEIIQLTPADVPDMLALKAIAFPGYFNERAYILGRFFGVRSPETNELIAMSGERFSLPTATEVSAVCTHPAHLGKGLAAALVRTVVRTQAARQTGSFLHTTASNARAIALYERLGFTLTSPLTFHTYRRNP